MTICPICCIPNDHGRFCKSCGSSLATTYHRPPRAPDGATPCVSCGVPRAAGERFCRKCGARANPESTTTAGAPVTPPDRASLAAAPAPPAAETPTTGSNATGPVARSRPKALVPLLAVVALLAVAGAAFAVTQGRDEPKQAEMSKVNADPGGAIIQNNAAPEPAATVEEPAGEVAPTTAETTEGVVTPKPPAPAAERAMREHWNAIRDGDYETAYGRFSSQYTDTVTFDEWSAMKEAENPAVKVVALRRAEELDDATAVVQLTVATVDRFEDGASGCNVFRGRVLVRREDGRWLYDPTWPERTFKATVARSSSVEEACTELEG